MKSVILVGSILLLMWDTVFSQTASIYSLNPRPKGSFMRADTLVITKTTPLIIPDILSPGDSKALWLLQTYISNAIGDTLQTVAVSQYQGDSGIFIGIGMANAALNKQWNTILSVTEVPPDSQGYQIDIAKNTILVKGSDADGLWFGVVTLRQLFSISKPNIFVLGAHIWDKPDFLQRWAYIASNIMTSAPVPCHLWIDSMIYYKLNGLIDTSIYYTVLDSQSQRYQDSLASWNAFVAQRNLNLVPSAIDLTSPYGPMHYNQNLASGLPSRSLYAVTAAGSQLVVDSAILLSNGNLESLTGTSFTDWMHDQNANFTVDSSTAHGGKYSARWQSNCKLIQNRPCKRYRCYSISGWVKTSGFSLGKIQLSAIGIDSNGTQHLLADTLVRPASSTSDWFKTTLFFNTLSATHVLIRFGTTEAQGTFWWDDLAIKELPGPTTVLHRNSTPVISKNVQTGMIYTGSSTAHIGDTIEYSFYYTPPSPFQTTCLSEDSCYLLLSKQALSLKNKLHASQYLLHESDIRVMNWDPSDLNRHLSPAEILGDHIKRVDSIFRTIGGASSNYYWSDMIDTLAHAKLNYRLDNGDLRQLSSSLPPSLTIINTNEQHRDSSLKLLYLQGFSQLAGVSVDSGKVDPIRNWRIALDSIPNNDRTRIRGGLYITHNNNYGMFAPFANYFWSSGPFLVHIPLDNDVIYDSKIQVRADAYPDSYDPKDSITDVNIAVYDTTGHLINSFSLERVNKITFARPLLNSFGAGFNYQMLSKNKQGVVRYGPMYLLRSNGIEAPLLVSPANNSVDTISLMSFIWHKQAGADSYRIEIAEDSDFSTLLVNEIKSDTVFKYSFITGLPYYWRVRVIIDGKQGAWSERRSFYKAAVPQQPILLAPKQYARDTASVFTFRWNKPFAYPEISGYEFVLSNDTLFTSPLLQRSLSDSTLSDTISSNAHYYWHVRASNSFGAGPWSETRTLTKICAPDIPILTRPVAGTTVSSNPAILEWEQQECDEQFDVELSASRLFNPLVFAKSNLAAHSAAIEGLAPLTTYYWRVRARDADFGIFSWSMVDSFATSVDNIVSSSDDQMHCFIYPNPTKDNALLTISIADKQVHVKRIILSSLTGDIIKEYDCAAYSNELQIELPALPAATYMVTLSLSDGTIVHRKVIIE